MKKLFLFSAVFAMSLAFTACSSDKDDVGQEQTNILDKFDRNGEAQISFNISLPVTTVAGTRTDDDHSNGQFDDGSEYTVNNAYLLLFAGSDETTATLKSGYQLTATFADDGNAQVTQSSVTTAISKAGISSSDNLYALVILNINNLFSVDGTTHDVKVGETSQLNKKLSELMATTVSDLTDSSNGYFMANAPISTKPGAASFDGSVTTLRLIDPSKIFSTAAAAEGNPAASIFVERVAAKIEVKGTASGSTTGSPTPVAYSDMRWALDNYNTSSSIVRQVASDFSTTWATYNAPAIVSPYSPLGFRFIENSPIDANAYRTYWGTDANYTGNSGLTQISSSLAWKDEFTTATVTKALNNVVYTHENTMDAQNQTYENTTRLVVAVKFNSGNTFYTISRENRDVIYASTTEVDKYVQAYIATFKTYLDWLDTYIVPAQQEAVTAAITISKSTANADKKISITGVSHGTLDASNVVSGKDPTTAGTAFDALFGTGTGKIDITNSMTFTQYDDGLAYYAVLIKHFGDTYTPWPEIDGTTAAVVYPSSSVVNSTTYNEKQRWLGRYGVVRNNWYEINIDGVRHIGEPKVPTLDDTTPDDQVVNHLSLKIAILPWAKRIQGVKL